MIAFDIIDHPYSFMVAYSIVVFAFGCYFGSGFLLVRYQRHRIKMLETQIAMLKLEVRK